MSVQHAEKPAEFRPRLLNVTLTVQGSVGDYGPGSGVLVHVRSNRGLCYGEFIVKRPRPIRPDEGQESVWDFPRPPRVETTDRRVVVQFAGVTIADSRRAQRVLETSHPPTYYIPREDVRMDLLVGVDRTSWCEWKGRAEYFTVRVDDRAAEAAAWSYPEPGRRFAPIAGHIAFYCGAMDRCTVDGERARPQPGGFYGGWVTDDVVGPFKGEPGTGGW